MSEYEKIKQAIEALNAKASELKMQLTALENAEKNVVFFDGWNPEARQGYYIPSFSCSEKSHAYTSAGDEVIKGRVP